MKNNIFDFATSELSHSGFFAWLISQIDPGSSGYDKAVRTKGLELVNKMFEKYAFNPIPSLKDIESATVEREESVRRGKSRIDIIAYIRLKDGTNIGLVIENKVGADESSRNQLADYHKDGTELIKKHFYHEASDKVFIYLKSDYDFEDPLVRFKLDKNTDRVLATKPTRFRKIDWRDLYTLFQNTLSTPDSILKSYSRWIKKKHDSIQSKLDLSRLLSKIEGAKLLKDHIGQVQLIKNIFKKHFSKKHPIFAGRDHNNYTRYYYSRDPQFFLKLGFDQGGTQWTQVWFPRVGKAGEIGFFYEVKVRTIRGGDEPFIRAEVGYWGKKNKVNEKRKINTAYANLIPKYNLEQIRCNFQFKANKKVSSLYAFELVGHNIQTLQKIEDLTDDFLKQLSSSMGVTHVP